MTPLQERDAALRGLVLGFKLAAVALANPLAPAASLRDEALLDDLAAFPPLLNFHPLEGLTVPDGQAAANAPARPRRAGQAAEPLSPMRRDAAGAAPEPYPSAARAGGGPAPVRSNAAIPSVANETPPVFRLSRRPPAEAVSPAQEGSAVDAASWPSESRAPGAALAQAAPAGEALRSLEALVEAILAEPVDGPAAASGEGGETSRRAGPPAAAPLPARAALPPLAIDQLGAAARAALAALAARPTAAPRDAAAPPKFGRAASSLEAAALERLGRLAFSAHPPQPRSRIIPELDAAAELPPASAASETIAAGAPLDADALAALINAALVAQARRYGVDLS